METNLLLAISSLIGTIFGSLLGVLSMSKLLTYRIEQLENKIIKLENLFERMTITEIKLNQIKKEFQDDCND